MGHRCGAELGERELSVGLQRLHGVVGGVGEGSPLIPTWETVPLAGASRRKDGAARAQQCLLVLQAISTFGSNGGASRPLEGYLLEAIAHGLDRSTGTRASGGTGNRGRSLGRWPSLGMVDVHRLVCSKKRVTFVP